MCDREVVGSTAGQVATKRLLLQWVMNKQSQYTINTKVNSAFHPSRIGTSRTSLSGWG